LKIGERRRRRRRRREKEEFNLNTKEGKVERALVDFLLPICFRRVLSQGSVDDIRNPIH